MKTPREIVEPMYDGADYQTWRILGVTCGALEELIAGIQDEAFREGQVSVTNMIACILEDDMPKFSSRLRNWSEELLKKPLAKSQEGVK